jgi:hypothetical protein
MHIVRPAEEEIGPLLALASIPFFDRGPIWRQRRLKDSPIPGSVENLFPADSA